VPKLSFDSYFGPSLGVKAFHDDLGGHDEQGSVSLQFGGIYNYAAQLSFRADHYGGTRLWLESSARFESEPALLFQGIGNRDADETGGPSLDPRQAAVATRFSQERYLTMFRAGYTFGPPGNQLQLGASALYNVRDFAEKQKGDEPSTEQVYDTSRIVGFDDRVSTLEVDLNLVYDTRDVKGATSSGLYLEVFGGRVPNFGPYGFWHHGVEATGYIDLYRGTRVLVLRAVVEGVEGKAAEIPFSELPRLGGPNRLRGYPLDRFRDEKAALGTVEYHYPIHQLVAGSLHLDVGRVANDYGDFLNSNWKLGGGGGFIVRSRDRQLFTFNVAYGEGVHFHITTDPLRAFTKRDTEL
jgi:outer membrane protein assembly factor BamA